MSNFENTAQSVGAFSQADDLKKRIIYTLFILIIYRFGTYIPIPGIDPTSLKDIVGGNERSLLGMFNVFAGGAVQRMAIFALGIMPYISSSIIVQLLTGVTDYFKNLKSQGEFGRKKITQYTRYGTVLLALVQGYGVSISLENSQGIVLEPGIYFRFVTTVTLLTGTVFLMWLGEQITSRGVGNGISLIIFSGIVAEIPRALASTFELGRTGALSSLVIIGVIILLLVAIYFIVFVERAQRRVVIQYPKRQVGNKMYGGESSYLPLRVNTAGVIPAIFASALLLLPITLSNFSTDSSSFMIGVTSMLGQGKPLYMLIYAGGIVFFSFFYTSIIFNPNETAENLRKHGGFIPGIRPGERTAFFINDLLIKLTTIGSTYLVIICLMPEILIANYPIPFYLGGTSLLIVVVVGMDTINQIQTRLMSVQYQSLIKKTKFTK
ncbi:MAG: preprotein translocase subunit SecY [Candidatus Pelagibacter sp.]|nr:preprotein translocase subunit SecY [Candidatus Pelagibacter sp.]OUW11793.1 MAG: preprotein translocase subunit SecY [Candidatus Pelagibacter sp. TMED166]|tara:strand:+ start:14814 stop:16124 length:1311 start_codon:yes stop_codon:yes gene_type:complete